MKILLRKLTKLQGTVLVTTVCVAGIIGLAVAAYLTLIGNENFAMQRSQVWNACMAVVEAGIEDGMAHINQSGLTNLASEGWTLEANGSYRMQRWIKDSYYIVYISAANPPEITSSGFVPLPLHADQYISRTVICQLAGQHMFTKAVVAKDSIDLKGNTITTDSFNSQDPTASTDGQYDPAKRLDNGDVATNSSITNSFDIGNADILGHVSTGPGGSIRLGPNGTVGDLDWYNTGHTGVQSNHYSDDMNIILPDVRAPYSAGVPPMAGTTINAVYYDWVLGTDNYEMAELPSGNMYVQGNATLLVTSSIQLTTGGIYIAPGASLKVYMAGAVATIGGNGIVNMNTSADSFTYFGLPANTTLNIKGTSEFVGGIYAPNADLTLAGGGGQRSTTVGQFIGSIVARSLVMNGNYSIHYDENMGQSSAVLLYVITTWNEI